MSATVAEKICVDCKNPFKPTSNVQKRCAECRILAGKAKPDKPRASKQAPEKNALQKFTSCAEVAQAIEALSAKGFQISITAKKGPLTIELA